MTSSTIWVLVASETEASISASAEGVSSPVQTLRAETMPGRPQANARCGFACAIMLELCRGALDGTYAGLIIVADAAMTRELQLVMPDNVSRLLISRLLPKPAAPAELIDWETPAVYRRASA